MRDLDKFSPAEISSLYSWVFGGEASHSEKVKALEEFLIEENISLGEIYNEIASSKSIVYLGEVMDGLHD